jgi:hypothetical protein
VAILLALGLAGCGGLPREATRAGSALEIAAPAAPRLIERDVPAPDVFQVTETGLWDGRPSLGGVWVAHPAARDPERVLIRNTVTGAETVGALFRRERENPGPRFQISSEAAAALGILAGQPVVIEVTALRLERVEPTPSAAPRAAAPEVSASPSATGTPVEPAATVAPVAAGQTEPPRRRLADLFRRREPAVEGAAAPPPAGEAAAVPPPATVVPAGRPIDTVEITSLGPAPQPPRRSLRDLFRRAAQAEPAAGITQTALPAAAVPADTAPLSATARLSEGAEAQLPVRPASLTDPIPAAPGAAAPAPRRSLRDLFRRRDAQAAATEPVLIPLPQPAAPASTPAPVRPAAAAAAVPHGVPDRPFVQVGIFAVEANATRTRALMQDAGLPAEIRRGRSGDRDFWRVVVGPASDPAALADLIRRARALGFADAYAVSG